MNHASLVSALCKAHWSATFTAILQCYPSYLWLQVENVALLANSRDVGHVGVNLYCDDQAIAKELPLNPRACQIAECCGKHVQVRCVDLLSPV